MPRREFPARIKVAAFERARGCCEDCGTVLRPGKFEYDHDIADQLGGEPTLENCVVRCSLCHGEKTAKRDVPAIAKAKRLEAKRLNAKTPSRRPLPGGKHDTRTRGVDGIVRDRRTGEIIGGRRS